VIVGCDEYLWQEMLFGCPTHRFISTSNVAKIICNSFAKYFCILFCRTFALEFLQVLKRHKMSSETSHEKMPAIYVNVHNSAQERNLQY